MLPQDAAQNPQAVPATALLGPASGQPQPNAPAQPAVAALGTPTSTGTPQPTTGTPAPVPNPHAQVAAANVGKHALLGRLASYLLGNESQYAVNPQTGQIDTTQAKRKPGDLFRSIVTGAIVGMAAGSQAHDFAGGVGMGGAAGIQQQRAMDQQRYARSQDQLAQQRAQWQQKQEQIVNAANLAHSQLETYKLARDLDIHSPDVISKANGAYSAKAEAAEQAGGHDAQIIINGQPWNDRPGNAVGFYTAYSQNPDAFKSPDGYNRIETLSVDTSGLTFDEHRDPATGQITTRWLDKDGQPVDMDKRTTIRFLDVPVSSLNEIQPITGAKLIALNPNLKNSNIDPDTIYQLPLSTVLSLSQVGIRELNDSIKANAAATRANAAKTSANARAAGKGRGAKTNADQVRVLNQQRLIAANEMASAAKTFDDAGYAAAKKKLDDIDGQLRQLQTPPANVVPPTGKAVVYDPQGVAHFVDSGKVTAFLKDPQYKGWHQ
jgi:hypothetical protein